MKYNSPLMKFLETIANMLIVSFFWIICSLPIFTVIPSTSALYHTVNKVIINGSGNGVIKDFFNTFKANFILGLKTNLICLIIVFFIVVGVYAGIQIYMLNIFGLLYLILGLLITFVFLISIIFLPIVVSRFYVGVIDAFKLSIFFAFKNVFLSILNILLLAFFILIVRIIPLTLIILPALYIDLIRPYTEKRMLEFINDNNLKEDIVIEEVIEDYEDVSMSDINDNLAKNRKKR